MGRMDRIDVQYLDGCERGRGEREVEERGGEVYLKPRLYPNLQCCAVLRGVAKVSYNVPKFAKITYTWTYLLPPGTLMYANAGKLL